jgi:hypothetical protein
LFTRFFARIDKLLGQSSKQNELEVDCPWAIQMSKDLESMKPALQENWKQLLAHCVLVGNSLTEKWKKAAAEMVQAIGATSFQSMFQRWTELLSEKEADGQINCVEGTNEHILCGLVRCSIFQTTDRTAAILGARVCKNGIPTEWISCIWEWPISVSWMESLGKALTQAWPSSHAARAPIVNPFAVILRNLIFLAIVLCHGFRRLAPPYY